MSQQIGKDQRIEIFEDIQGGLNTLWQVLENNEAKISELQKKIGRYERSVVIADYKYKPARRESFSKSHIATIITNQYLFNKDKYSERVSYFYEYADKLEKIPLTKENDFDPYWNNGWLNAMDGMTLYTFTAKKNPRLYVECGSGNSTKFVRKAISDNNLRTKIISIDPHPRAEIDAICDHVYRLPLEDMDLSFFNTLSGDDILIMDNSHRAFPNSDVTVFFTEILPTLPHNLLYALHDIVLPDECFTERFYNEQYMLATYIIGGAAGDEIYFPSRFLGTHTDVMKELPKRVNLARANGFLLGGFFWMLKS